MKHKIFGILGVLMLLSALAVYAHGTEKTTNAGLNDLNIFDFGHMNEMHDEMTQDLEPELKEELDLIHEGCMRTMLRY